MFATFINLDLLGKHLLYKEPSKKDVCKSRLLTSGLSAVFFFSYLKLLLLQMEDVLVNGWSKRDMKYTFKNSYAFIFRINGLFLVWIEVDGDNGKVVVNVVVVFVSLTPTPLIVLKKTLYLLKNPLP